MGIYYLVDGTRYPNAPLKAQGSQRDKIFPEIIYKISCVYKWVGGVAWNTDSRSEANHNTWLLCRPSATLQGAQEKDSCEHTYLLQSLSLPQAHTPLSRAVVLGALQITGLKKRSTPSARRRWERPTWVLGESVLGFFGARRILKLWIDQGVNWDISVVTMGIKCSQLSHLIALHSVNPTEFRCNFGGGYNWLRLIFSHLLEWRHQRELESLFIEKLLHILQAWV